MARGTPEIPNLDPKDFTEEEWRGTGLIAGVFEDGPLTFIRTDPDRPEVGLVVNMETLREMRESGQLPYTGTDD